MRSTKDLKGMVSDARGQRSTPIGAIPEDTNGEERKGGQRIGGANYMSTNEDDAIKKLRKLEVLAATDKETIEA